jgi:hypothetical protein
MVRLSRRKVVVGLGSAPLLAHGKSARAVEADPVLLLCAQYGDLARRQDVLMRRCGDHEDWLAKHRNWFSLKLKHRLRDVQSDRNYVAHGSPPAQTGSLRRRLRWRAVHRIERRHPSMAGSDNIDRIQTVAALDPIGFKVVSVEREDLARSQCFGSRDHRTVG